MLEKNQGLLNAILANIDLFFAQKLLFKDFVSELRKKKFKFNDFKFLLFNIYFDTNYQQKCTVKPRNSEHFGHPVIVRYCGVLRYFTSLLFNIVYSC